MSNTKTLDQLFSLMNNPNYEFTEEERDRVEASKNHKPDKNKPKDVVSTVGPVDKKDFEIPYNPKRNVPVRSLSDSKLS